METTNIARNWFKLFMGILLIAAFMFAVAPFLEKRITPLGQLSKFIDRQDVNMNAYTYADSELSGHAIYGARNTMEHMPAGPK